MADDVDKLSKNAVIKWRAFVQTPEYVEGIMFLRTQATPAVRGKSATELLEQALKWGAYNEALDDLKDVLCQVSVAEGDLETSGLE